jgi:hypothetical protein
MLNATPTDDPNFYVDPLQQFGVPQGYGLPQQLAFPTNPLGAFTDEQYLADDSALRAQIGQQYAGLLQQLGYMDPNTGNVIPGTVVQDANIQAAQELQQEQDALRGVVGTAQNQGTLFSGNRQIQTQQALYPHQQNLAQLGLNTQRTLGDLYNQSQNMVTNYNMQNQQNLASAAARNLAAIQQAQLLAAMRSQANVGGGVGGGGGGENVTGSGQVDADANIGYAESPVGQQMIQQVQAHPASAGSSGAAQTLLAAGQGLSVPNYQAARNAAAEGSITPTRGAAVTQPVGYTGSGWTYNGRRYG